MNEIVITIDGISTIYPLKAALVTALKQLVVGEKSQNRPVYSSVADYLVQSLNQGVIPYAVSVYPDPALKAKQDAVELAAADVHQAIEDSVKIVLL